MKASRLLTCQLPLAGILLAGLVYSEAPARTLAEHREEKAAVQALFDEARQLAQTGDFAGAAARFERIAQDRPKSIMGQQAALQAGIHYFWAGQIDQSLEQFDLAASLGVAPNVSQDALYEKARFCVKANRPQDALAAIDILRVAYPESRHLRRALELRGEIQGKSPGEVEAIQNRELDAGDLLAVARYSLAEKPSRAAEALDTIERLERDYADTSAAVAALAVKGDVLHALGRFEEAKTAYRQLIDRVVPLAPRSPLAVRAKLRLPFEMMHRAEQLCAEAIADGVTKDAAKVQAAREECTRVLEIPANDNGAGHARARALLVEIEIFDNQPQRAEHLADKFLREHYSRTRVVNGRVEHLDLQKHPEWILVMHLCIAQAAAMEGNYEKSLEKYASIKQLLSEVPESIYQNSNMQRLIERIYLDNVLTVIRSKADRSTAAAVAGELLNRFPNTFSAEIVRRRLVLPADGPSSDE